MKKKLFFKLSDGCDVNNIVMTLDACMEWIKSDDLEKIPESELPDYEYILKPILLTDEEFSNLPEADI